MLLYYIVIGKFLIFFSCFIAVLLHELSHSLAGRKFGYQMTKIILMPYGAMIYGGEKFNRKEGLVIALAGPFCNAILALLIVAVWWIAPPTYSYTLDFLKANLSLLIFNLLPCFPLDGSRVVLSFCQDKLKGLRFLKVVGIVISFFAIICGIASFFYLPNLSLISIGVFLFTGAVFASKKEEYNFMAGKLSFLKDYNHGVVARDIYVSENLKVFELLRFLNNRYLTTFIVVDSQGNEIGIIDESKLKQIVENFDYKCELKNIF